MKVLVDTSVWSLAFRRDPLLLNAQEKQAVDALKELLAQGCASILGVVRQEVLSGITAIERFNRLETILSPIDDDVVETSDHIQAAQFFNLCRAKGIQGSLADLLICAIAHRYDYPILTTDKDFLHYARLLPIRLHPAMQAFISI